MSEFVVKDSGERQQWASGMVRDVAEGKVDYTLLLDGPMLERWAQQLHRGAVKYNKRNWTKAQGQEEYDRFRESALRHMMAWLNGQRDEDHAAAVIFNLNGAEYVLERMGPARPSEAAIKVKELEALIAHQQDIINGMADRIAKQSDQLGKNAEKLSGKKHT